MGREANVEKYQKVIELIKAVNDAHPKWHGMLNLVLFDDGSGHFECKSNFYFESIESLEPFGIAHKQTLDDLFVKYGIE